MNTQNMKMKTTNTKKIDPLSAARDLLRLQRKHADPRLLHLALEILGVPRESRDCYVNIFEAMVVRRNDIGGYIDIVTGKRPLPKNAAYSNVAQLEEALYGVAAQRARRRAPSKRKSRL
jgi:hypothetical protein